jgi:type I restriction enzyme S subunit
VYDGLPAYFQDSNIVWIDNSDDFVKNSFLYYCYGTIKWTTENTTIARLYNDNLRNIKIHIPCLQEQTKIANFLSAIDEDVELLESQLAELELQKKGLMQGMFV